MKSGCLVVDLREIDSHDSMSRLITSRDCENRAGVLCIQDSVKATKVDKKPNLSCLLPTNMALKNDEKNIGRTKRGTIDEIDMQFEKMTESKMIEPI